MTLKTGAGRLQARTAPLHFHYNKTEVGICPDYPEIFWFTCDTKEIFLDNKKTSAYYTDKSDNGVALEKSDACFFIMERGVNL